MLDLAFLFIPLAGVSGWYLALGSQTQAKQAQRLPRDYLIGLNFLLNEQPDKAVDVFIKMLEVDNDTVETHLALGSLFRRRGEVDRATRIHQNLIARPNLDATQRAQALLALGQDYMRAGVLDRAERIFQEVVASGQSLKISLKYLIDIYQQEKAWNKAIITAKKLSFLNKDSMKKNIAHYYCELAETEIQRDGNQSAKKFLKQALNCDSGCARSNIIFGNLEKNEGSYRNAISHFKEVVIQDPEFITEILQPLTDCYVQLEQQEELMHYLQTVLKKHRRTSCVLILAREVQKKQGISAAVALIKDYLQINPSVRGLKKLIELQLHYADVQTREQLNILNEVTEKVLENRPVYRCQECGFDSKLLHWLCPHCRQWSTQKPIHGLEGD